MSGNGERGDGPRPRNRPSIWNRLRGLGLLHERDLIRIYHIAQQQRVTPEWAAVALGIVTQRQMQDA